ncbi:hypothetical protein FRC08_005445 [Ceratobasidium sp. 394]|nr:hypothetical protein FRC08_005445 [Ceratobasidium sp. 394]
MAPPLTSFPSEILARVFSEACYRTTCPTNDPPPILSISAVCRRWRQITLDHRSLWTHIGVEFDILDDNGKFYLPEVWLMHSKGAPLFVHIVQARIHDENHEADEEEESMQTLFPNAQREVAPNLRRLLNFLSPLMPQALGEAPADSRRVRCAL